MIEGKKPRFLNSNDNEIKNYAQLLNLFKSKSKDNSKNEVIRPSSSNISNFVPKRSFLKKKDQSLEIQNLTNPKNNKIGKKLFYLIIFK